MVVTLEMVAVAVVAVMAMHPSVGSTLLTTHTLLLSGKASRKTNKARFGHYAKPEILPTPATRELPQVSAVMSTLTMLLAVMIMLVISSPFTRKASAARNTTKTLLPCHDAVKEVVVAAAEAAVLAVRGKLSQQKEKAKVGPCVEPRTYIEKAATYSHSFCNQTENRGAW
jgi:hypothetical protein